MSLGARLHFCASFHVGRRPATERFLVQKAVSNKKIQEVSELIPHHSNAVGLVHGNWTLKINPVPIVAGIPAILGLSSSSLGESWDSIFKHVTIVSSECL